MPVENIDARSFREVTIYLREMRDDIHEMREAAEEERRIHRETKAKRTFMLVTAFVAPIIVSFISNAIFFPWNNK